MARRMSKLAASPAVAIFGAGAALVNPGVFIPIALKTLSELNPTRGQYFVEWVVFALVSLLPLAVAILLLIGDDGRRSRTGVAPIRPLWVMQSQRAGRILCCSGQRLRPAGAEDAT